MEHRADDKAPARGERPDEVKCRQLVGRIEVRCWFVKEENVGLLGERHGNNGALTLATGELVDPTVREGGHLEIAEGRVDRGRVGTADSTE